MSYDIPRYRLKGTEVSDAVQDICENQTRNTWYFLHKYKISYDEWSYLSFAALPMIRSVNELRETRNRLYRVENALLDVVKRLKDSGDKNESRIASEIRTALENSLRKGETEDDSEGTD